jgi:hypothetical protein
MYRTRACTSRASHSTPEDHAWHWRLPHESNTSNAPTDRAGHLHVDRYMRRPELAADRFAFAPTRSSRRARAFSQSGQRRVTGFRGRAAEVFSHAMACFAGVCGVSSRRKQSKPLLDLAQSTIYSFHAYSFPRRSC